MAFLLLKDGSYPLVLGTKKLVQLQIKVINILTSSIIIIILIYPILISLTDFYKNKNYPEYIKTSVKLAFITSIIPIIIFLHLSKETIVSNWHWLTIHTTKLSLSLKLSNRICLSKEHNLNIHSNFKARWCCNCVVCKSTSGNKVKFSSSTGGSQ
jgi:hypothetical protein